MNKTKKQIEREKKHEKIIAAFLLLDKQGGARMAIWAKLEKKFGYSRQGITKVLRQNGIDYEKTK